MANVRKSIRAMIEGAITQINALVADVTALAAGDKPFNSLRARTATTKIIADLTALRTNQAAIVTDAAMLKAALDALVTKYNAALAKLDADAGVTDTNYAATDAGTASSALTAAAPSALTASASTLGIGNGTTAGRLRTNSDSEYAIAGVHYTKAPTDNLWDLHSELATASGHYRAYVLYLDASGTASFAASVTDQTTSAAAIADLDDLAADKAVIGMYVAGPSTNFANALAAQGTITDGTTGTVSDVVTAEAITLVSV